MYEVKLSIHWISRPRSAESPRQNVRLGLIFDLSRFSFRCAVPSFPRLSKSNKRITSKASVCSISCKVCVKDLPPVLTVKTSPETPKPRRASTSFFPSTTMGVPLADSSESSVKTCIIFSCFSLRRVDKGCFTL
jgi:hypothetical protein